MTQEELDAFMNETNEPLSAFEEGEPKKIKLGNLIETISEEIALSEHYAGEIDTVLDANIALLTTLTLKFPHVESFEAQLTANRDAKKSMELLALTLKEIALQL